MQFEQALRAGFASTIVYGLNIAGPHKWPLGSRKLFLWGWRALAGSVPQLTVLHFGLDPLGPCAIFGSTLEPAQMKRLCMAVERGAAFCRLLDLDVYNQRAQALDRRALGLPQRTCLVCLEPARECILLGRHEDHEIHAKIQKLLAPFHP